MERLTDLGQADEKWRAEIKAAETAYHAERTRIRAEAEEVYAAAGYVIGTDVVTRDRYNRDKVKRWRIVAIEIGTYEGAVRLRGRRVNANGEISRLRERESWGVANLPEKYAGGGA